MTEKNLEPHHSRGPTTLEGWRSAALEGEKERDWLRERLRTVVRHQEKDCWYWQNDGADHLESMTNALPVVIRADQLRALLASRAAEDDEMEQAVTAARTQALEEAAKACDEAHGVLLSHGRTSNEICAAAVRALQR